MSANMKEVLRRLGIVGVQVDPATGLNVLISRDGKRYDSRAVAKAAGDLQAYNEAKALRTDATFRKVAENTPDAALAAAEGFQKGGGLVDTFDAREGPEKDYPVASTVGRMVGAIPQVVSGVGLVGKGVQAVRGVQAATRGAQAVEAGARGVQAAETAGQTGKSIGGFLKRKAADIVDDVRKNTPSQRLKDIPDGGGMKVKTKTQMKKDAAAVKRESKGPTVKSKEQSDRIVREMQRENKRDYKDTLADALKRKAEVKKKLLDTGETTGGVRRVLEDGTIKGQGKSEWQKLLEKW